MRNLIKSSIAAAFALMSCRAPAMAQEPSAASRLQFNVTPYVWLPTIDATINNQMRPDTSVTTNLSYGVGEYLSKLNFAGMVAAEARYERFSVLTDFIYLNANSNDGALQAVRTPSIRLPITDTLSASTRIQSTIWTLAGGYAVAHDSWGQVDVIGGVRLLVLDQNVNYLLSRDVIRPDRTIALSRAGSLSASGTFWNGIAGLRGRFNIGHAGFYVPFYVDIGTGADIWTWQAASGVGYKMRWVDLSISYRYMSFQSRRDSTLKSLTMGGPLIAATFTF